MEKSALTEITAGTHFHTLKSAPAEITAGTHFYARYCRNVYQWFYWLMQLLKSESIVFSVDTVRT